MKDKDFLCLFYSVSSLSFSFLLLLGPSLPPSSTSFFLFSFPTLVLSRFPVLSSSVLLCLVPSFPLFPSPHTEHKDWVGTRHLNNSHLCHWTWRNSCIVYTKCTTEPATTTRTITSIIIIVCEGTVKDRRSHKTPWNIYKIEKLRVSFSFIEQVPGCQSFTDSIINLSLYRPNSGMKTTEETVINLLYHILSYGW